jgi:hypothetical protein
MVYALFVIRQSLLRHSTNRTAFVPENSTLATLVASQGCVRTANTELKSHVTLLHR